MKLAILLACLAIMAALPLLLVVAALNSEVNSMLIQNMPLLKGAFVAWVISVFVGSALE